MKFLLVFAAALACAQDRRVAITIDDLPVAQSGPDACEPTALMEATKKLLAHFKGLPLTAFVIGRNCPDLTLEQRKAALGLWMEAGAEMGNHSYSHRDYNSMPATEYAADIERGDASLKQSTGLAKIRYFRSPMLHTGRTKQDKQHLERFLAANGWQQAPVTFDNSDWLFANVYAHALRTGDEALAKRVRDGYVPYMESVVAFFEKRSVEVVGRDIPHVLLFHSNHLNRDLGGELVNMFRRRGYRFITLEEALRDDAYRLPDEYAGTGGFSWIHRWSRTMGMPNKGEPGEPKWVLDKFEEISRR